MCFYSYHHGHASICMKRKILRRRKNMCEYLLPPVSQYPFFHQQFTTTVQSQQTIARRTQTNVQISLVWCVPFALFETQPPAISASVSAVIKSFCISMCARIKSQLINRIIYQDYVPETAFVLVCYY